MLVLPAGMLGKHTMLQRSALSRHDRLVLHGDELLVLHDRELSCAGRAEILWCSLRSAQKHLHGGSHGIFTSSD